MAGDDQAAENANKKLKDLLDMDIRSQEKKHTKSSKDDGSLKQEETSEVLESADSEVA